MRQNSAQIFGKKCQIYQKIVTILPTISDNFTPRNPFYVNLYCQIAYNDKTCATKKLNMGRLRPL